MHVDICGCLPTRHKAFSSLAVHGSESRSSHNLPCTEAFPHGTDRTIPVSLTPQQTCRSQYDIWPQLLQVWMVEIETISTQVHSVDGPEQPCEDEDIQYETHKRGLRGPIEERERSGSTTRCRPRRVQRLPGELRHPVQPDDRHGHRVRPFRQADGARQDHQHRQPRQPGPPDTPPHPPARARAPTPSAARARGPATLPEAPLPATLQASAVPHPVPQSSRLPPPPKKPPPSPPPACRAPPAPPSPRRRSSPRNAALTSTCWRAPPRGRAGTRTARWSICENHIIVMAEVNPSTSGSLVTTRAFGTGWNVHPENANQL